MMKTRWNQSTLRYIIFATLVVSAYLGGRWPQVHRVQRAEFDAATSRQRAADEEQVAHFWRDVALDSREDFAFSIGKAERVQHEEMQKRMGYEFGGSGRVPTVGRFPPRHERWDILFSTDESERAKQFDAFGITLVAIWQDPPAAKIVSRFSEGGSIRDFDAIPSKAVVAEAEYRDYLLLNKVSVPASPTLVVRVLPESLVHELLVLEFSYAAERGYEKADMDYIERTDFDVQSRDGKYSFVISQQLLRVKADEDSIVLKD